MYKFILVCSFLLLSLSTKSQVNTYFNNDPVWTISSGYALIGIPCNVFAIYNYFLDGDTVINSNIYKKVFRRTKWWAIWSSSWPPPPFTCPSDTTFIIDSLPANFIRSDQKIMYLRLPNDTIDRLLYNFNLDIGDSLPYSFVNPTPSNLYVTSIDSFFTPNGYYKIFNLSSGKKLIEGVGSSYGLIEPMSDFIESGTTLHCFSLNGISYFPSTGLNCEVITSIKEADSDLFLSVFPNPFSDHLIIKKEINDKLIFKVFNAEGKLIEEKLISTGTEEIKIELNLINGFYFYSVTDESGKIISGKLIKN